MLQQQTEFFIQVAEPVWLRKEAYYLEEKDVIASAVSEQAPEALEPGSDDSASSIHGPPSGSPLHLLPESEECQCQGCWPLKQTLQSLTITPLPLMGPLLQNLLGIIHVAVPEET